MKRTHKPLNTLVHAAVVSMIAGSAYAGGFSLYTESNGEAIGNYAAGIAAEARDASTGWYNPAGLAFIHSQQAVLGGVGVFPTSELSGTSIYRTTGVPGCYTQTFSHMGGGQNALVPSFHYAKPLGENLTFGLSLVSPFGLATQWSNTSPVRYAATFTQLNTFNLSPELGGKVFDHLALGAGLDLQYAKVKFNSALGSPALLTIFALPPTLLDTQSYNKGHSFGLGFHAGVLSFFNENHTRVGFNYQSQVKQTFHGTSRLVGRLASVGNIFAPLALDPLAVSVSNSLSSNEVALPDVSTLSVYQDVTSRFALLGSLVFTNWSTVQSIQLNNVAAPVTDAFGDLTQGLASAVTPQNFSNAWRAALGANYQLTDRWLLRVGGGYDQTPTNDVDRNVRLPDGDRWALSAGAHYQMYYNLGFDMGYTHLFSLGNPSINNIQTIGTSSYSINADIDARANLVGAQVVWEIDKEKPVMK